MNSLKSVSPRTQLASYTPGQEINFELTHDGEALVPRTVCLTGRLVITGQTLGDSQYYDPQIGVAGFMENVVSRSDLFQEVITNYSRLVKIRNSATMSQDSQCMGLKNTSELCTPHVNHTNLVIANCPAVAPAGGRVGQPFAHMFVNALNNMSGALDYAKSGRITLSFKLPSAQKVFFGADAGGMGYSMTDLELHYMTTPQGAASVAIDIVEDTQKLIQTTNTTIQNTFINPVDRVLVSFAPTDAEQEPTQNAMVCVNPQIQKMSWVYNDQSNALVAYEIESIEEQILSGYSVFDAMNVGMDLKEKLSLLLQDPVHCISDKFIVGLRLGQLMDFSRTGLGLNVRIPTLGANTYYAYFYGLGQRVLF